MNCVPVNNKQNVSLPNRRVMVKPKRKLIFRPFNDGQHVALPNRRVMVKPTRKVISDPSTSGNMWPCRTDAS